jgi:hypothetical protein
VDGAAVDTGSSSDTVSTTDAPAGDSAQQPDLQPADTASKPDIPKQCPVAQVYCKMMQPDCPEGTTPEPDPCPGGHCPARCWTGKCVPCGTECQSDSDCELVGRHGCCGPAGDCAKGCFWAEPKTVRAADNCYFAATCPIPSTPPAGCPTQCTPDPKCKACPHCGPNAARCEGGLCVSAWTACEPNCMCD